MTRIVFPPPERDNLGAQLLRAWLRDVGATQHELALRCLEFSEQYGVPGGIETRQKINHISRARRRPTAAQAIILQHVCDIDPGDWYRSAVPASKRSSYA